jgi:hypothetical protein
MASVEMKSKVFDMVLLRDPHVSRVYQFTPKSKRNSMTRKHPHSPTKKESNGYHVAGLGRPPAVGIPLSKNDNQQLQILPNF